MEEACERARRYVNGLKNNIKTLNASLSGALKVDKLKDAIERYLSDSEYYLSKGDCLTALVAVSYAEGLLDSLRYLGVLDIEWGKPIEERKVLVAGTFDIIHPGHIELLRYASSHGKLYVIVSRDVNAAKSKGRPPVLSEDSRLAVVSSIRYVYKAMLGDPQDYLKSVERVRPDIIVLGPDQPFREDELARALEERLGYRPKIIRFKGKKPFNGGLRGTRDVIRRICEMLCAKTQ